MHDQHTHESPLSVQSVRHLLQKGILLFSFKVFVFMGIPFSIGLILQCGRRLSGKKVRAPQHLTAKGIPAIFSLGVTS
jgi:hypothetical protein